MEKGKINVNINLDGLLLELLRVLQRSNHLVSYGLQLKHKAKSESPNLPIGKFELIFEGHLNWDADEIKRQYNNWILTNGFRDTIEGINGFLESVHSILSYWDLTKSPNKTVEIKGSDWNKIIVDGQKQFHRLGLPVKLKHLSNQHDITPNSNLTDNLISANTARSCLVHRNGIIAKVDVTEKDFLEVKWIKAMPVLQNEDGEKELVPGEKIQKESKLAIKNKPISKKFNIGESIIFTDEEFEGISWSHFQFGNNLIKHVKELGEKLG